ncbi:MAG: PIN domain-containing protein [Magnetococcales bacterium]|nr:PIN domain-containing protein [Magnetococcales bacterium]
MLVYLDLCCFNRPFDDQARLLVRLQTEAKLHVQSMIREGNLKLVWSAVIDLENAANPDVERRMAVAYWKRLANVDISPCEDVEKMATAFSLKGVKPMDALHVACAIKAGSDYFLTTDKALLRKLASETCVRSIDPTDFVRNLSGETHAN